MKCKKCNNEVLEGISFCPHCGAYLREVNNGEFSSNTGFTSSNTFINNNESLNENNNFNSLNWFEPYYNNVNNTFNGEFNENTTNGFNNQNINNLPNSNFQNTDKNFINIQKNDRKKGKKISNDLIICLIVLTIWIVALYFLFTNVDGGYFFEDSDEKSTNTENYDNTLNDTNLDDSNNDSSDDTIENRDGVSKSGFNGIRTAEDVTAIIYDNQYFKQIMLNSKEDVLKLIVSDSINQKNKCPEDIKIIENDIVNNYGITAVNLCEMDIVFARELRNVVAYVYNEYPTARGYMTNLTLANVDKSATYMAAFMPIFTFATSNTVSSYPVGIKTQILLNTKYFLNSQKLVNSVSYGAKTGYFPQNATRSSTVAHEFGHYLSYVAMLNYYKVDQLTYVTAANSTLMFDIYDDFNRGDFSYIVLQEAYTNYKKVYPTSVLTFDEFRQSISTYAVAKNSSGKYIYDETIAEAFHDCYLNGDMAKPASLFIVETLTAYL